jgi:hypothetical protein
MLSMTSRGGSACHRSWLGETDLASIPSFLGWFARRHGRHTPAALLHDQLIPNDDPHALPLPVPAQLVGERLPPTRGVELPAPDRFSRR